MVAHYMGALCAETHDSWLEDHRYLNMDFLKAQKTDLLQTAARTSTASAMTGILHNLTYTTVCMARRGAMPVPVVQDLDPSADGVLGPLASGSERGTR